MEIPLDKPSYFVQFATLAASLGLPAQIACAQAFDAVRLYGAAPGKNGGLAGLAVIAGHEYPGSDERRLLVVPLLDYQWANGWFAGVTNGLGFNFSNRPDRQYGLRVTADLGRYEKRSRALRGMGDVEPSAEVGAFFNHLFSRAFFASSSLRVGSGEHHKGALLDLGAGYSSELAPRWRLGAGLAATLANADYLQSFFGITPAQSATSGYASYTPGAGLRDVRLNVSLTHRFNPRLGITAALSASTLLGDAKDSPLTRQQTAVNGILALSYAF